MSAPRASETPSTANSLAHDLVASLRTVQVPGSPATYANRAALREMGLRWNPVGRRWHGTTTAERVKELRERLGLEVRCFGDLETPPKGPVAPKSTSPATPVQGPAPTMVLTRDLARRPHDGLQTNPSGSSHPRSFVPGTRTRVEARIAFPVLDEPEEIATPTRRFSIREITSGLPDDSRDAEEKVAERQLLELRARIKRARAAVSATPGLSEILRNDWRKAARFYARFRITRAMFQHGVFAGDVSSDGPKGAIWQPMGALAEAGERPEGALPSIENE